MLTALTRWLRDPRRALLALASLIPLLLMLAHNSAYIYNFPLNDQWSSAWGDFPDHSSVDVAARAADGTLTAADLFQQHTSHRIFFSQALTALNAAVTGWDIRVELYAGIALAVISALLLVDILRAQEPAAAGPGLLAFALLTFSLRQDNMWRAGFLNVWFFLFVFLALALWLLCRLPVRWRTLFLTAAAGVGATFALFPGFLVWPVLFVSMYVRGYRKPRYQIVWLLIFLIVIALYFTNYDLKLSPVRPQNQNLNHAGFVLAMLGAPFVPFDTAGSAFDLAALIGAGGLALLAVNAVWLLRRQRDWQTVGVWLSLALFGVGTAAATALGRNWIFDRSAPLTDRYVVSANWLWLGLIALGLVAVVRTLRAARRGTGARLLLALNGVAALALAALYVPANIQSQPQPFYPATTEEIRAWSDCLLNYPVDRRDACFDLITHRPERAEANYERASALADSRLTVFGRTPPLTFGTDAADLLIIEAPGAAQARQARARLAVEAGQVIYALPDGETAAAAGVTVVRDACAALLSLTSRPAGLAGETAEVWHIRVGGATLPACRAEGFAQEAVYPAYANPQQPFTLFILRRAGD